MSNTNSTLKLSSKAIKNFKAMKESIRGVHEVFKLALDESDIFYNIGMDNLLGLYDNFLQLMMNEFGAINFMRKLKHSKIDLDLSLDHYSLNKK
jgi:hypothetical protein